MYLEDGLVVGKKGFMLPTALKNAMNACGLLNDDGDVVEERTVVLHFRIATHGGVKPTMCHPFPLSKDEKDLQALSWVSDFGLAHNGTLYGMDTEKNTISDTMAFCKDYLSDDLLKGMLTHEPFLDLLQLAIKNNKFIIMHALPDGGGIIHRLGDFYQGQDGNIYSNSSFQKKHQKWNSVYSNGEYYGTGYGNRSHFGTGAVSTAVKNNVPLGNYKWLQSKIYTHCQLAHDTCDICEHQQKFDGRGVPMEYCRIFRVSRNAVYVATGGEK